MSEAAYDATIDALHESIGPRATALLGKIRNVCREAGLTTDDEPFDMSDDTYRWSLRAWLPGVSDDGKNCIDISIEIAEAREYGDDSPYGVNFGLSIVEWGGRIIGDLSPYNYTPDVWVDARDADAIEDRWMILETSEVTEIPTLILRKDH